jgi:anthranilate/para-aminobenzoate synthase component II
MAVRHRSLPVCGVQFHPESIATDQGRDLLKNFIKLADAAAHLTVAAQGV